MAMLEAPSVRRLRTRGEVVKSRPVDPGPQGWAAEDLGKLSGNS
jgi:hypothetical protein